MIKERPSVPLSPPTSPRMSGAALKIDQYPWPSTSTSGVDTTASAHSVVEQTRFINPSQSSQELLPGQNQQNRPPLRSHRSFPYSLGPSSRQQYDVGGSQAAAAPLEDFAERVLSQGPQPTASAELQQPTFGGSAPTSPVGNLTPHSQENSQNDAQMEDEELEFGTIEQDLEGDKVPMTAAELRAQKRKMKRFRLTHNQTRFLMSEFTRQAHPDAAHRERLSREIPGLSPRQVQVWFQNRRAKLKRLTSDDRERMMRSRALPADFDMTQALHSPFGTQPANINTPLPSPGNYASFGNATGVRPLTLDTLRRVPDYEPYGHQFASPTGISPAMGAFAFTPPQSATETMSPHSAASNMSSYAYQTQESPGRHAFGTPAGSQAINVGHPQLSRLNMHERFARQMGEAVRSPLRASMSYSGLNSAVQQDQMHERPQSLIEQTKTVHERPRQARSATTSNVTGSGPYGLGFTYGQITPYQPTEHHQQTSPQIGAQPTIDVQAYRRGSSHLAGPPISYAHYPAAHFVSPPTQQYPQFGPHFATSSLQHAYQPHVSEQQEQGPQQPNHTAQQGFTPVQSATQHFVPLHPGAPVQETEEGDNSDGGVLLPSSY